MARNSADRTRTALATLHISSLSRASTGTSSFPLVASSCPAFPSTSSDVAAEGATVDYEIPDLPPGEHFLALFLDDDLDADPMAPAPDPGDLVYADVAGDGVLSCVPVIVEDEDVEDLALLLTVAVPGA